MKDALITGALPIYAKMLADSCGVEVEIGARSTAATDGRTIYLPQLPSDSVTAKKLAYGMIMHEAGHVEETSFAAVSRNMVIKDMANRLEDIRMERVQQRKFPGGKKRLADMVDALVETGYFLPVPADCSANAAMACYILTRLRVDVLGQKACEEIAAGAEARCRELLPAAALTRLRALMYQVEDCRSTQDVVALSEEIVKMLEDEASKNPPPPPQQPQPPQSSGDDADDDDASVGGDSGDGDADDSEDQTDAGGNSGDGDDSDDGAGNGDDAAGDDDSGTGSDSGDGNDDAAKPGAGHGDADKLDNLRKILSGEDSDGITDLGDLVKAAVNAQANPSATSAVLLPEHATGGNSQHGAARLGEVAESTRALKRKLFNLLEAEAESTFEYGRHGRLAGKRIVRAGNGDTRVFERMEVGLTLDTAVMVLLDRSGSMGSIIDIAGQTTLALTNALDGISGVNVAAAAFPHWPSNSRGVLVLKEFEENIRETAGRFHNMGVYGCTPLAEALMWSGWQLARRKEARKILFVATDGDPDDLGRAQYMLKQLRAEGIETLGLGIGINIQHLFPISREIQSVSELSKAVFDMMSRQLMLEAA